MFRQVDWEITLDGDTYAGCFNLHKRADLERALEEIKSEIEGQMDEEADDA